MTHSPLPWRAITVESIGGNWHIEDVERRHVVTAFTKPTAALIVHRVNTYDALVDALELAGRAISTNSVLNPIHFEAAKVMAAALTLAKETPK